MSKIYIFCHFVLIFHRSTQLYSHYFHLWPLTSAFIVDMLQNCGQILMQVSSKIGALDNDLIVSDSNSFFPFNNENHEPHLHNLREL